MSSDFSETRPLPKGRAVNPPDPGGMKRATKSIDVKNKPAFAGASAGGKTNPISSGGVRRAQIHPLSDGI